MKASYEFSLELKSVPVTINGRKYTLTELTGAQRDEHLNDTSKRIRLNEEGKPAGITDHKGMTANLISLSLTDDETKKQVPAAEIQKWPARVQNELYKAAQELSGLGKSEDEAEKAKNDSEASALPGSPSPTS